MGIGGSGTWFRKWKRFPGIFKEIPTPHNDSAPNFILSGLITLREKFGGFCHSKKCGSFEHNYIRYEPLNSYSAVMLHVPTATDKNSRPYTNSTLLRNAKQRM